MQFYYKSMYLLSSLQIYLSLISPSIDLSMNKQSPAGLFLLLITCTAMIVAWVYKTAFVPLPPRICGTIGGPPITAPRIKLRDGRYLSYKESGFPKEKAQFKIIFVHGFDGSRNDVDFFATHIPQEKTEKLKVYIVAFDRPGYGESDPHPGRTTKSMAFDVEDLADQLNLGDKFYLMSYSLGGQTVWSCLNYIPHRLAGAALLAPAVNYWWEGFPTNISREAFRQQLLQDQWVQRIAHYTPWLTYWWNTQTIFPAFSLAPNKQETGPNRQQGDYESIYRDLIVVFRSWGFNLLDMVRPCETTESFHLWQGDEDEVVPVNMQRYIAQSLPWIQYHEIAGGNHSFGYVDGMAERILRCLLVGQK